MSRLDIPTDRALSADDRAYLLMRGEDARVAWFDQTYPAGAAAEAEAEGDEEGDDYDKWTVAELDTRIKALNEEGAEITPASGKKADLIAALREYDALPDDPEEE